MIPLHITQVKMSSLYNRRCMRNELKKQIKYTHITHFFLSQKKYLHNFTFIDDAPQSTFEHMLSLIT